MRAHVAAGTKPVRHYEDVLDGSADAYEQIICPYPRPIRGYIIGLHLWVSAARIVMGRPEMHRSV